MITFSSLGLKSELLQAIEKIGFEKPTDIQEKTIPILTSQKTDLIGLAQTGTGKTAAFGLPLLQGIDTTKKNVQGLILVPTRELCLQITKELQSYAHYLKVNIVAVYGGASISVQLTELKRGAQIIVATPGRMLDVLQRGKVNFSQLQYTVLDEADEMLNMGFYEEITQILAHTPSAKQTWLFSATMPKQVSQIAKKFMGDYEEISIGFKNQASHTISHVYYETLRNNRFDSLIRLIDFNPSLFGVIFCRTKRQTQEISDRLMEHGYNVAALHGDLSQAQRDQVMKSFRLRQIQLLVATDVAARGIDVDDITHVIHYQLPDETEIYTHRSGRTGRAGKEGISVALIGKKERSRIAKIESIIGDTFSKKELPDTTDIYRKQLFHRAEKLKNFTVKETSIENYLPELEDYFSDTSKSELIKRLFASEFDNLEKFYTKNKTSNAKNSNFDSNGETRFFINLGSKDGFKWTSLKDFLKANLNLSRDEIFKVDVLSSFSFFNTSSSQESDVLAFFEEFNYKGRKLQVEVAKGNSGTSKRRKKIRKRSKSIR